LIRRHFRQIYLDYRLDWLTHQAGFNRPMRPSDLQLNTQYEGFPSILIEDGNIVEENLEENKLTKEWLLDQLKGMGIENERHVFAAMLDTLGNLYVSRKDKLH
ncbi:MAG: DUF421 domain-containing protein, partial [Bacillota bacterium]|nr:DUF421 domain-containing protein [Bacillota bacterium]